MPVFFFAISQANHITIYNAIISFIVLHFFLYPASNAYNSYFDKDEKSIGGLKNPPPVSKPLYYTSLCFDLTALILALTFNWIFAFMAFIYGLVSKAYSHPSIRLKKYPILSWLTASLFQGAFTFFMVIIAVSPSQGFDKILFPYIFPAFLSSLLLAGFYPITQIYQHREDKKRGDHTLSLILGVKGTFHFAGVLFFISIIGFYIYFYPENIINFWLFLIFLFPVIIYFSFWYLKMLGNLDAADYKSTMRMNLISSSCLIGYFITLLILN